MKTLSIILIILTSVMLSCKPKRSTIDAVSNPEIAIDSFPGDCAYLTSDVKGNTVLSWARTLPDSSTAFCYSLWKDGIGFSSPIIIPNTGNIQPHGENLPKIIFKPSGEIIALWGIGNANPKNKYSGLVSYVQSFDNGKSWSKPRPLTLDTASFDQRYYDVALLSNGEVGILWLDNRKTIKSQGSGLFFASTLGKNGFQNERMINQPCCQCCRTDLFVDRKGSVHALFRAIIQDSIRDMVHMVSGDGGNNFSSAKRISDDNWVINGCPHTGPAMTETGNGLQFAWFTGGKDKGCFYSHSSDNGNTYSKRNLISHLGSHPQLTTVGEDVIVVWDEMAGEKGRQYKRIGLQHRYATGFASVAEFITGDSESCSYPVVSGIGSGKAIVAYSVNKKGQNHIRYQVISPKSE